MENVIVSPSVIENFWNKLNTLYPLPNENNQDSSTFMQLMQVVFDKEKWWDQDEVEPKIFTASCLLCVNHLFLSQLLASKCNQKNIPSREDIDRVIEQVFKWCPHEFFAQKKELITEEEEEEGEFMDEQSSVTTSSIGDESSFVLNNYAQFAQEYLSYKNVVDNPSKNSLFDSMIQSINLVNHSMPNIVNSQNILAIGPCIENACDGSVLDKCNTITHIHHFHDKMKPRKEIMIKPSQKIQVIPYQKSFVIDENKKQQQQQQQQRQNNIQYPIIIPTQTIQKILIPVIPIEYVAIISFLSGFIASFIIALFI